ncbi:MAG: hypothetical protein ACK5AL_12735, partial [Planctomycetota bacterium]
MQQQLLLRGAGGGVAPGRGDAHRAARPFGTQFPRSLRHGTRADPVRGFAAGAKPTTGGESVDSP